MNSKLYLIISLSLIPNFINAQVTADAISKAKDYVNYRITNDCINTLVNTVGGNKYLKQNKLDIDLYKKKYDSIRPSLVNKSFEDGLDYNTLANLLKNKFDRVTITVASNINKLTFSDLDDESDEKVASEIATKALNIYKQQYENKFEISADTIQSNLEKDLLLFLEKSKGFVKPVKAKDTVNDVKSSQTSVIAGVENKPSEVQVAGFFSFSNFNFWTLFLLLLFFGLLLFCLKQFSKVNRRVDRRKKIEGDDGKDNIFLSNNQLNQSTSTFNKKDIEKHISGSEKISELNEAISKLQLRLSLLEATNEAKSQTIKPKPIQQPQPLNTEDVFYMMRPVDDYFPDTNKSYSKNETVYKFTLQSNKSEALFEIHTGGASVGDIAKRNETYIKPACEEENIPGANVTNIITKRQGVASLEGDKWVIKSKAIIRYE